MKSVEEIPEWLQKCMTCTHSYVNKSDGDVCCRCRKGKCNYKEYKKYKTKEVESDTKELM